MPAILPGPPVVATPSHTPFEPPGQNRVFEGGHDADYMALQLQRLQRLAR